MENLFGILFSGFPVFRKSMLLELTKTEIITMACLYLHNYVWKSYISKYACCPSGTFDIEYIHTREITSRTWRNGLKGIISFIRFERVGHR